MKLGHLEGVLTLTLDANYLLNGMILQVVSILFMVQKSDESWNGCKNQSYPEFHIDTKNGGLEPGRLTQLRYHTVDGIYESCTTWDGHKTL